MKRFNTFLACVGFGIFIYVLIMLNIITPYNKSTLFTIGINIILAVSLNLIVGITGQFSLGHAGFMAIGAYSVAITLQTIPGYFGLIIGLLIGMVLSALLSLVISIPTLRLKGDYLAIATLGFSEIIRIVVQNLTITGGSIGISGIEKLLDWPILYLFIVLSVCVVLSYKNSKFGRACLSIKEDEIASEAVGIHLRNYKVLAFTIGVIIASVAGGLYAVGFNAIAPGMFSFSKSIDILVIVVLGGLGSVSGSILAAILLGLINMLLAQYHLTDIQMIIYALVLIGIMLYRQQGLLGTKEFSMRRIFKKEKAHE